MDIHRCRFVPYPPYSINALAFSHPPGPDKAGRGPSNLRLALGRANGDIEIWNPLKGAWIQETILRGAKDRTIEGLTWIQDPEDETDDPFAKKIPGRLRLFSVGYSASVTEWDLETGTPARHASSNYGEIWCLSPQPHWKPQRDSEGKTITEGEGTFKGQYLAAGCSDGTIVLFTTEDGELTFLRRIGRPPTKRPRILSITWKDRYTIVAGYADSTIRVFDIRSKAILRNMTLGKAPDGSNEILVWCVRCLSDGTIISGDSTGEVKIWDPKNYSLSQRIMAHQADILDIAVNGEGNTIVTGGADRRTTILKLMGNQNSKRRRRWAHAIHRRYHQHDVKALAVFESKELSVCVSGGLDTIPVVMPLREWQTENHRTLSNLPQQPQISSSPASRLFATWWDREIHIWQMRKVESMDDEDFRDSSQLVAQVRLTGEANISSAQLSHNGRLLAVATNESIKLFQLKWRKNAFPNQLRVRKIDLPQSIRRDGAKVVAFSPDSRWVCVVGPDSSISLLRITSDLSEQTINLHGHTVGLSRSRQSLDSHAVKYGSLGDYERVINKVAFSSDSRVLAAGDISGTIDTWTLEGQENQDYDAKPSVNGTSGNENATDSSSSESDDSEDEEPRQIFGQRWIRTPPKKMPNVNAPLLFLSFRPSKPMTSQPNENGHVDSDPNQHNHYPHSHSQGFPSNVETLIAVTAHNHILEFDVMRGRLSEWSKRNPMSCLPYEFRQIKDRAIGGFWDIADRSDRLWLYGPNWVFMFDLLQDFGRPNGDGETHKTALQNSNSSLGKRKRLGEPDEKTTRNTGAGDATRESERYSRLGPTMKEYVNAGKQMQSVDVVRQRTPSLNGEDDEDPSGDLALARLRRYADDADVTLEDLGARASLQVNGVESSRTNKADASETSTVPRAWWHTYVYRSIYGAVPIGDTEFCQDWMNADVAVGSLEPRPNLEVVLVERPEWDLELPPRYDDGRDWTT